MIELFLTAALFGGCAGGSCTTVQREVTKTRSVLVNREVEPVRNLATRVRERERVVFKHRVIRRK
jgi:hypothetical protein